MKTNQVRRTRTLPFRYSPRMAWIYAVVIIMALFAMGMAMSGPPAQAAGSNAHDVAVHRPLGHESANGSEYIGDTLTNCQLVGAQHTEYIICDTPEAPLPVLHGTPTHTPDTDDAEVVPPHTVTTEEPPVVVVVVVVVVEETVDTKPGHGYGDDNHVHTGPPGLDGNTHANDNAHKAKGNNKGGK